MGGRERRLLKKHALNIICREGLGGNHEAVSTALFSACF